jgi:LemA protein
MAILVIGVLMALVLFWAVGAHNRLVRLRSDVIRQWSSVDAVWLRLLVRLQGGIAARQSMANEDEIQALQSLQLVCDDLLEALTQVRLQPLEAEAQKMVVHQHQRLVAEVRQILLTASEAVRPDLDIALNRMRQTLPAAVIPYHVAVASYNEALVMLPAAWLAQRLQFKPALRMDLSVASN